MKWLNRLLAYLGGSGLGYLVHYVLKETYTAMHEGIKQLYSSANLNYNYPPYPENLAIPFAVAFGLGSLMLYEKYKHDKYDVRR